MKHELHNHPITESRECIPKNKVLIDKEFVSLFEKTEEYWDTNHVIVDRKEYDKIKQS